MRSSTEIRKQIQDLIESDKKYNNLVNEGGEGYQRNSVSEKLNSEYLEALEFEFKKEWTLEKFNEKREIWNREFLKISSSVTAGQVVALEIKLGIKTSDLKKAKKILNLN